MTYEEVISIVVNSTVNDWNVISCWGLSSGPSYKSRFEFYEILDGKGGVLKEDSHGMYAIFKPNVSISLAFGLTANGDFKENWANSFSDPHASSHLLDLFFLNSLVERISYVVVDGGRVKLPIPKSAKDFQVNKNEYMLIKLIDNLESGTSDFDSYFESAKLILES